jgi:hypothetical protein
LVPYDDHLEGAHEVNSTVCLAAIAAIAGGSAFGMAGAATAKSSAPAAVKAEYRKVLSAEFFGPARAVCSQLTTEGLRAYTGGVETCDTVFAGNQRAIALKVGGGTAAPNAAAAWRNEVTTIMAHLNVKISGRHATASDPSGAFRRSRLEQVGRGWKFTSAPPLPGG